MPVELLPRNHDILPPTVVDMVSMVQEEEQLQHRVEQVIPHSIQLLRQAAEDISNNNNNLRNSTNNLGMNSLGMNSNQLLNSTNSSSSKPISNQPLLPTNNHLQATTNNLQPGTNSNSNQRTTSKATNSNLLRMRTSRHLRHLPSFHPLPCLA